jgi:hypothetical protein
LARRGLLPGLAKPSPGGPGSPVGSSPGRIVSARENLLISGGTGTGKTTILNMLSAAMPIFPFSILNPTGSFLSNERNPKAMVARG